MKISHKLDYALKTLLDLALNYQQELVNIADLAQRMDIPKKFLEQILLELKKGGFVDSKRGKEGGYLLAQSPENIKLGEIVRFIDGSTELIECLDPNYKGCLDLNYCIFRNIWEKVDQATNKIINKITFADLVNKYQQLHNIVDYSI